MHMSLRPVPLLTVLLGVTAALPAQTTFVVDPTGGGNFVDLPPAVGAASPGDILLVRAGTYSPTAISKGIRILADPGATFAWSRGPSMVVSDVPANQTLVVRGLGIPLGPFVPDIVVQNNAGHVHLESMGTFLGVHVLNSRQVSLYNFRSTGEPLLVRDSTLLASRCDFAASDGVFFPVHGVECERSTVTIAESTCSGGGNLAGFSTPLGSGIHLISGDVTIAGDASTRISAGVATGAGGVPTPAILTGGGTLNIEQDVTLVPSHGGAQISGPAAVTRGRVPSLDASVTSGNLDTRLYAPGAVRGHTLLSFPQTPPLPTPFGGMWIGFVHLVVDSGNMPANGIRAASTRLPPLPAGLHVVLQGLVVQPTTVQLSAPIVLTLDG